MKKFLLLFGFILLLSGCGKEKTTCTLEDNSLTYKSKRTIVITTEKENIYSFKSTIEEEHPDEESANNSYVNYQTLYTNYNENNVISEFKKDGKKITAIYNIDLRDIETHKIEFEFDFTKNKSVLINTLKGLGYKCK